MDGFERRKEQSREKILNAADALFIKHGIKKVSVDDIAREAGVSKVTIYNLFGSKGNLVQDLRLAILNKITTHCRKILSWEKSYLEKIQDIIKYWVDITNKYNIEAIDSPELLDLSESQSESKSKKFQEEVQDLFIEFIKEGKKQGNFNPDISDETASTYLQLLIQGLRASPEIQTKMHNDPNLSHGLFLLMFYGFSLIPKE